MVVLGFLLLCAELECMSLQQNCSWVVTVCGSKIAIKTRIERSRKEYTSASANCHRLIAILHQACGDGNRARVLNNSNFDEASVRT